MLSGTRFILGTIYGASNTLSRFLSREIPRNYSKKCGDKCRKAIADIPPEKDRLCPDQPCERQKPKKLGILHKIKLRFVEGGTNFGTPFRRVDCKTKDEPVDYEDLDFKVDKTEKTKALVPAEDKKVEKVERKAQVLDLEPAVQVSILGADTAIGQYVALLLKQCSCIKKLRLYQAQDPQCCTRDLGQVVHDLQHINTSCGVQAFSCACYELERCLQNTDIVLMLENACVTNEMPYEQRFCRQAPIVKCYADAISNECPKAFIIVCATPTDCLVPLIAETMKESGWHDPRKIFGSLAIQEMRASTLAARALCLEPRYTRVPCVGGTEGESLVPLFSKAVEYFDFAQHNATLMTDAVRSAPFAVARTDGCCARTADLSEAHAIAGLVTKVAHALMCHDVPKVTGFVATDACQIISPARYIANHVCLGGCGIIKNFGLPKMNEDETTLMNYALNELNYKELMVAEWYMRYFAIDTLLNREGICKQFELPPRLNACELAFLDTAIGQIASSIHLAETWHSNYRYDEMDKLLNKLEENEPELASSPDEECVICVNAKATMQTSPCGHRVVCRRCFVKTIQMAVSQRLLPLRCVICRAKILRLRQAPRLVTSKSWQVSSGSGKSWGVPGSVSSYSVGARSVPASASLYSVTSGESSLSGVSSVSSNSGGNVNACSTKLCGGAKCGGACLGAVPRAPVGTPPRPRQPASNSLRRSQHHSMKARLQDYQVHSYTGGPAGEPSGRLPPIREFQREFREGRRENTAVASTSTRIRCAQKIVTQLETSPQKDKQHFFRPLKPPNKDDPPESRDHSKETDRKKDNPKSKSKKEDKTKKDDENTKQEDKSKKDETNDNRKNEIAERKKEEKIRLKAEKEAKKEAKLQAKEEERQAKLLAKEEEKQAKLRAKEEKKKAKKEAKLAAQAEKEKNK